QYHKQRHQYRQSRYVAVFGRIVYRLVGDWAGGAAVADHRLLAARFGFDGDKPDSYGYKQRYRLHQDAGDELYHVLQGAWRLVRQRPDRVRPELHGGHAGLWSADTDRDPGYHLGLDDRG